MDTPTYTTVCTKYPHPDEAPSPRKSQVRRIYAMADELRRRDLDAYAAARDFAWMHIDDLYSIETTLRQALEALDAADDRRQENELRNQ